ncbi:MAG: sugar phosphate isomerase/epimerase [Daejeonella sp.]|uniref:sugar phosphate isomerase/epimerase family protein n=1 Tax=Daejeonella sp. TaxID=2805397 RepID=UPI002733CB6A|nr:sugar phosphate isomerase/epimerase [Daejeonella sp.]MDP3470031.1 sugar phosphate isomerase/epimerase [Daejeonella sp.]
MITFKNSLWYLCLLAVSLIGCADNSKKAQDQHAEWNMGVALYSFNRFSFADALDKADSAGVKYVEGFSFHNMGKEFNDKTMAAMTKEDISEIKEMLSAKNLEMQSMYVSGAKTEADWKYYFELAKDMNMQHLVCEPEKESWDKLDSLAGIYNIKIAIHEHAKGKSLYWHPDSVIAAMKDHPNFGVCADLGHWERSGLNPAECLKKLEGKILGVHLKDIHESNNPDANDVIIGKGVINFPAVIDELKGQQYKGVIHVECEHKMENNLAEVIAGKKYFEGLYTKVN